jgi:hypothetical protein
MNQIVFILFPWKCNGIFLCFISSILIVYKWKLTNFNLILQPLKKILFFFYWVCKGFKFFLSYYRQNTVYFVCGIFFVLLISLFLFKPKLNYMTDFYFMSLKCREQFYILSHIYIYYYYFPSSKQLFSSLLIIIYMFSKYLNIFLGISLNSYLPLCKFYLFCPFSAWLTWGNINYINHCIDGNFLKILCCDNLHLFSF